MRKEGCFKTGNGILIVVLLLVFPLSFAAAGQELPLTDVVGPLTQLRLEACLTPQTAFSKLATAPTAARLNQLGSKLCPLSDPEQGWKIFFGTAVSTMTSLTDKVALTMFYSPWADVALLCEWQSSDGTPVMTDVELVCGDVLRESKEPQLIPLWRRAEETPPPLTVMVAANDTVRAFMDRYGKRAMWGGENWRKKLNMMKKADHVDGNYQVAGILFSQSMASVNAFFNDPAYAEVKTSFYKVRDLLMAGNTDAVLAMAPETTPEAQTILREAPLEWENGTMVLLATDAKNAFVFMADLRYPEHYACFWFNKTAGDEAALRRIDFLSHVLSFDEVDAIARQAGMQRPMQ